MLVTKSVLARIVSGCGHRKSLLIKSYETIMYCTFLAMYGAPPWPRGRIFNYFKDSFDFLLGLVIVIYENV